MSGCGSVGTIIESAADFGGFVFKRVGGTYIGRARPCSCSQMDLCFLGSYCSIYLFVEILSSENHICRYLRLSRLRDV
jgi:hypothetical protein